MKTKDEEHGEIHFRYDVPMETKNGKFAGFLSSNTVPKKRVLIGHDEILDYKTDKVIKTVEMYGVPLKIKREAEVECKLSLERKLKLRIAKGYIPLKMGWKSFNMALFNNRKSRNGKLRIVDEVMLILNNKRVGAD